MKCEGCSRSRAIYRDVDDVPLCERCYLQCRIEAYQDRLEEATSLIRDCADWCNADQRGEPIYRRLVAFVETSQKKAEAQGGSGDDPATPLTAVRESAETAARQETGPREPAAVPGNAVAQPGDSSASPANVSLEERVDELVAHLFGVPSSPWPGGRLSE